MRLHRHVLFGLTLIALSGAALGQDADRREPVRRATAAFARVKHYEQPVSDLPVPTAQPAPEMREVIGFAEYLVARDHYLAEVRSARAKAKDVDSAYSGMVLQTIEDLAEAIDDDEAPILGPTGSYAVLRYQFALYHLHQADEKRRAAGREMYRRFAPAFRLLPRAAQDDTLRALQKRTEDLADARRHNVALVEHHRRRFADRLERAERDAARGRDATIADAASALLGDPHLNRAYLWLVPETALHLDVTSELVREAETVIANAELHPLLRQAFRDHPRLGPADAIPPVGDSRRLRLRMLQLRARRCRLHLHRREAQAEAMFKRAASILRTSAKALADAKDRSATVLTGMKRNPDERHWSNPGRIGEQVGLTLLAEAAVVHQLLGDLFGAVVFQPAVDITKNAIQPFIRPMGVEAKDSVRKAYDAYSKQKRAIEMQVRVLDALVGESDWEAAQDTLRLLRGERTTGPGSILQRARNSTVQMLQDAELIESTDGGLLGAFVPVCEDPRDARMLHVAVGTSLLTANQLAAAARVGAARGIAGVEDPYATGPQLVALVLNGPEDPMAGFPDRGFYSTWAYLMVETPRLLAVDWVYGLPTRVKNGLEQLTGRAGGQDEQLALMQHNASSFGLLRGLLARHGNDFAATATAEPATWVHHEHLLANCYEYVESHRRILADAAERDRLWISAAHEVESTRGDPVPALTDRGRIALSDVQIRDEMDQARLAVRAALLRLRQLALTGEFAAAAVQLRVLEPLAEHWLGMRSQGPVDLDYAPHVQSLEVEAVRGDVVQVFDGLYKSTLNEMAISFAAGRLSQAVMAHKSAKGGIRFQPPKGVDKWGVVRSKLWNTLNPWAGTFSLGGVYALTKNAAVQASRETLAAALAKPLGVREEDLDKILDTVFSIIDDARDQYRERYEDALLDDQADPEVHTARRAAVDALEAELQRARNEGDEDAEHIARAALLQLTGQRTSVDDAQQAILDAAEDHAVRLANAVAETAAEEQVLGRLQGREPSAETAGESIRKANAIAMNRVLRGEDVRSVHFAQMLHEGDAFRLHDRLFGAELDIQTLRRALTRAATNDPGNRELILAQSMALDLLRVRRTDALVGEFLEGSPWREFVTVHRAANGAAVIGDSPEGPGNADAPGIHQDLDIDFVVREGAPGGAQHFMKELHAFLETKGYRRPEDEGQRTTFGARFFAEDESPRARLQRKSGQTIRLATEFEGERLSNPDELSDAQRQRLELSGDELTSLETKQGFHRDHSQRMNLFAKLFNAILVVRDSNPDTVKYMDDPDYMAKPMECKAKTAKVGDDLGLVVNPRHPVQAAHWDAAIAKAKAEGSQDRVDYLEHHRGRAERAWDEYGGKMKKAGYEVDGRGVIFKEPFKGVHGDYDLHGVFTVEGAGAVSHAVSYGDGSRESNRATRELRAQLNAFIRGVTDPVMRLKEMVLHGGQDNWDHPGKTSDPPVTIFLPDSVAERIGRTSPVRLATAAEMRDFYEIDLAVAWEYSDGRGDFWTKLSDVKSAWAELPVPPAGGSRKIRSVGAQRWRSNQRTSAPKDWIPIARWQTYGMLLDLLPHLEYLTDASLRADSIGELPNARERMDALRRALSRSDAFLILCDAWLLSQPLGSARYHERRRAWRTAVRRAGSGQASSRAPRIDAADLRALENRAEQFLRGGSPRPSSYRSRVLEDVEALGDKGFSTSGRERLALLVRSLDVADRVDPFSAQGLAGDREVAIRRLTELFDWMRHATARMAAEIGSAFAAERVRILTDGTESEVRYVAEESARIAQLLDAAALRAPGGVLAFGRPPFALDDDAGIVDTAPEDHAAELVRDLRDALDDSNSGGSAASRAYRLTQRVEAALAAWEALAQDTE